MCSSLTCAYIHNEQRDTWFFFPVQPKSRTPCTALNTISCGFDRLDHEFLNPNHHFTTTHNILKDNHF